MDRLLKKVRSTIVDPNTQWHQTSDRAVVEVFTSRESLQKEHGDFKSLTGFTSNLILSSTSRVSSSRSSLAEKAVPSKVSPEDIFSLILIPVVGKFGAFYQGFDKRTWTPLTLKIFKPRIFINGGSCKEKQILSLTKKPHAIPKLIAAFRFELQNCLVLEYMTAYSLQDKLLFCRRFPPNVVLFFMCDMVMAIAFLHNKGLIHRNVTLNVFWIQPNGHLKLVDYTRCVKQKALLKKNFRIRKTLDYAPPEVFKVGRCTKSVDTWALGVILYKMTTGRQPFYADTEQRLIRKIKSKDVVFNTLFNETSADLCKQLLQKDPKHRLGFAADTFLCVSSHPYFANVSWDLVLTGTSKAPEIPLLMSAVRQARYKVRPLDFRDSANRPKILKNKPLLLQELSTKSVSEMFSEKILNRFHAANIAKYKKGKQGISLPKHNRMERFSFQKISSDSSFQLGITKDDRSPIAFSKPPPGSANETPPLLSPNSRRIFADEVMCFLFIRLSLEESFADALDEFQEKAKKEIAAAEALEELREYVNKKIDEIKAATVDARKSRHIAMRSPAITGTKTV